jgi:starch phosphorylase
MNLTDRLQELARNLYWTWHPDVIEIFRDLDPSLWREVNHNPVEFLDRLPEGEELEKVAEKLALEARITHAFHRLREYLEDKNTWGAAHGGPLRAFPVAYFSAEFGLHESMPIYSGGLGVLAGDHLKAASDLGIPLIGIGLFYAEGYFEQSLDSNGWQQEDYSASDPKKLPLLPVRDDDGKELRVRVETPSSDLCARIWTARVGRTRLLLLDTNVDENSEEDRKLTAQLYGGDQRTRIRQELILGVGGMRALEKMDIHPGVIHLNEGHCAFASLEMARRYMVRENRSFEEVKERAALRTVFTTHTPVEAGHDRFDSPLVNETLGKVRELLGLSERDFLALGRVNPDASDETFCMTVLALRMSRSRNGVSNIHAGISRAMWNGLWPEKRVSEVPIGHITNGVHLASWLAIPMAEVYRRCPGIGEQESISGVGGWGGADTIGAVEFWEQHQILKAQLIQYVRRCLKKQANRRGEDEPPPYLDQYPLTIGFARRFAGYKRAHLLLSDRDRLAGLVNSNDRPLQIIFAGKAHPADEGGKKMIQEIFRVTCDNRFAGKVVFIEDYDINVCRHLVQGVDLWLNTPRRPREACGTSGQKVVLNGGLNLSILDGWWAEAYDGNNGFAIGSGEEHSNPEEQDRRDAEGLFEVLENDVLSLFYKRDEAGIPHDWVARQKNAIRGLAWRFSAWRMVMEYALGCYLPAAGGVTSSLNPGAPSWKKYAP